MRTRENESTRTDIEPMSKSDCLLLLSSVRVGRLGVIADGYPLIFPVNYGLDGDVVVIRTHPGTKLTYAQDANVCFEADNIDYRTHTGWSVVIRGRGAILTPEDPDGVAVSTWEAAAVPWVPGPHEHWLRITPEEITGRRITPEEDAYWRYGTAAYM